MKIARLLFFFILAVLTVTALSSLLISTSQTVDRSITINAPASVVYGQLSQLQNFNKFSAWTQSDTGTKYTLAGVDGTVGASSSWKGDPHVSGEGKLEIISLVPDKKIVHHLHFVQPRSGNAESVFIMNEKNGITTLTWSFELATPRPWNIFNLFYSLDKKMGKDFEDGLVQMKKGIESVNGTASSTAYEVQTMDFPATKFAMVRQQVKWSDLLSFFSEHLPIIYQEAKNANTTAGTASGLIFSWDTQIQQGDIAAAVPVGNDAKINNPIVQSYSLPASKAIFVNYHGSYDKLPDAYNSIHRYLSDNKLKEVSPSIEQYIAGPMNEKDTAKWLTKIVYLVK
jgi:effector-binding domain-containing protein